MTQDPQPVVPPRALFILLILFLVIPSIFCGGCCVASYFLPPIPVQQQLPPVK